MTKEEHEALLKKVILLNLEDARQWVKVFREKGDEESLKRALADLHIWEKKVEEKGYQISNEAEL